MAEMMVDVATPFAWFAAHDATRPATRRMRVGDWTLVVTHDRFTDAVTCHLRARSMDYAQGAVTFQFGRSVRTYEATYRVDGKPAVSWRANAMVLARTGALTPSDDLENPSGGRVAVPLSELRDAQTITIRPSSGTRPVTFKIGSLSAALATADAVECGRDFLADSGR